MISYMTLHLQVQTRTEDTATPAAEKSKQKKPLTDCLDIKLSAATWKKSRRKSK